MSTARAAMVCAPVRARGGVRARARGAVRRVTTRAMGPELRESVDAFVRENKVVLFMKGTKAAPRCGFSNTCVQILQNMNVPFADVDILANEDLRQGMKEYSSWPTFPQLYIGGEFFGGCDITVEAFKDGSLKEELERAMME
ncbi:Monothiol glutaredoxin-related [Ostreococcus tauri]|uniref:Monothiol glutaredoxin-related n=2 Tax=Ostreococcus tauri TaxID=70448 RepID=A0A090M2R4_OSTTA|nr:Monothiol glutaredoxin-related [Ostreococcus tauri]CEF96812.1 Monothiol glutaredoxin-related [Ostreococcus tauri]|eukprot:XP_022838308.1 Monothiol glutaredoxin-related [Ostreococcus tauri]